MKYQSLDLDLSQCVCKTYAPSTTLCGHETSGTRAVSFTEWFVIGSDRLKRTYSRAQKHWKLGGLGEPLRSQVNKTGGGRFWLSSHSKCVSWVSIPGLVHVYYHHIHEPLFADLELTSCLWGMLWLLTAVLKSRPKQKEQRLAFRYPKPYLLWMESSPVCSRVFLLSRGVLSGWGSIDNPHLGYCRPREALCLDFCFLVFRCPLVTSREKYCCFSDLKNRQWQ